MKKIGLTIRVPVFIDLDCEMSDDDFDNLLEEWDNSNFGIVQKITDKYVDIGSIKINPEIDRCGESELVDFKLYEETTENDITDEVCVNSIAPKGKPN